MPKRDDLSGELRQRARRAIVANALMRWESAILIALTLVGTTFLVLAALIGLLSWLWPLVTLAVGSVAWAAVFVSSLSDQDDNAKAVAKALREHYSPKRLRSVKLRTHMDKALKYWDLLNHTVQNTREGVLRSRLARAVEPVDDWIEATYELASRLDNYELNSVIQQDLRTVPATLEDLKQRLSREHDETVEATLRDTIASKTRQLEQLNELQTMMQKASYQLESTLAMLGTIYAQLQTIDLQGAERGRTEEIRTDINEQVQQLQDLREAMDEVYNNRSAVAR